MDTVNVYILFNFYTHTHSWYMMIGNLQGKLSPGTVMFQMTKIEENTAQKITDTQRITLFITQIHTQSHGHKPTLLTIIQLLPGTTVISHIALLINYFLSPWPYTHSQQEFGIRLPSTLKPERKPQLSYLQSFFSQSE